MQNGQYFNSHPQHRAAGPEINLVEIIQTLYKRRYILISCVAAALLLAVVYNFLSTPVYESSVSIKKEKTTNERSPDEFSKIIQMQTLDEVETEVEVLKTRTVLDKVVNDLNLYFSIQKVVSRGNSLLDREMSLAEYQQLLSRNPDSNLPRFSIARSKTSGDFPGNSFYILLSKNNKLALYEAGKDRLLQSVINITPAIFDIAGIQLSVVDWPRLLPGDRVYFTVENPEATIRNLENSISVAAFKKTNIFKLSVQSSSPFMAQLIANSLTEKFRETRVEHKREAIRYSLSFVDEQLSKISEDLKNWESQLSDFRSDHRITNMDETLRDTRDFLSNIEAEKMNTDLALAEYQSRYEALVEELKQKGYFDQTYLTPNESSQNNSPFSELLQELSKAELGRLELLQKRTANHPDVRTVESRIAEIKDKLSSYNQNTITAYRIIINALVRKQSDLQALVNKYAYKVGNLLDNETELMDLIRKKNAYEKMFNLLLSKREEMRIAELSTLQDIVIVDPAYLPVKPVLPRKLFNLIIAFVLGSMAGLIAIFLKEFHLRAFRNYINVENELHMPILGVLPKYGKFVPRKSLKESNEEEEQINILTDTQSGFEEYYEKIEAELSQLAPDKNTILFASCEENTGKTTILSNFARHMAASDKKVLVIDCDFTESKPEKFLSTPQSSPGLIEFLTNGRRSKPSIYNPIESFNEKSVKLNVIPAGGHAANSSELLNSVKFRTFLQNISSSYDYIFIDTPPTTKSADSLALGSFVNNVILFIPPDITHKESLYKTVQNYFKQFGIKILGAIISSDKREIELNPSPNGFEVNTL